MAPRRCAVVLLYCQQLFAQAMVDKRPPLKFDVASIRVQPERRVLMGFSSSGQRLTLTCYTSEQLISEAFQLKNYQISWAAGVDPQHAICYDIIAVAPEESTPTREDYQIMLKSLLIERFDLRLHVEQKTIRAYALTLSKSGAKLTPSADDTPERGEVGVHGRNQTMYMPRDTMSALASQLQSVFFVGRPVVNRTGLSGPYAVRLEATPEFRINNSPEPDDVSIFAALQQQLGLKLESVMEPVQVTVIEHINSPTEN